MLCHLMMVFVVVIRFHCSVVPVIQMSKPAVEDRFTSDQRYYNVPQRSPISIVTDYCKVSYFSTI